MKINLYEGETTQFALEKYINPKVNNGSLRALLNLKKINYHIVKEI